MKVQHNNNTWQNPQEVVMMVGWRFFFVLLALLTSSSDHWGTDNVHYAVHETIGDLNKRKRGKEKEERLRNGRMDIKVYWNCFVNVISESWSQSSKAFGWSKKKGIELKIRILFNFRVKILGQIYSLILSANQSRTKPTSSIIFLWLYIHCHQI